MSIFHSPIPHGDEFANSELGPVWAAVRALEPEQLLSFAVRLQEDLKAVSSDINARESELELAALTAVREAQALHLAMTGEEHLSSYRYQELQQDRTQQDWPPLSTVYLWLGAGTWQEVLERCHLPTIAADAMVKANYTRAFSADDCIAALNECARDLQAVPSWWVYKHWAKRRDVIRRPGQRPRSQSVFTRCFGSFSEAVVAAGLVDGSHDAPAKRTIDGRLRPTGYRYHPDVLRRHLREAAKRNGAPPSVLEYERYRDLTLGKQSETATGEAVPDTGTFLTHFGSWEDALRGAGLDPSARVRRPKRGRLPFDNPQILRALREAHAELGDPLTEPIYRSWRRRQLRLDDDRRRELPEADTIRRRFGTWGDAIDMALGNAATEQSEPGV